MLARWYIDVFVELEEDEVGKVTKEQIGGLAVCAVRPDMLGSPLNLETLSKGFIPCVDNFDEKRDERYIKGARYKAAKVEELNRRSYLVTVTVEVKR